LKLIETKHDLNFDGMNMTVEGELVPVATVDMRSSSRPIFFEHHILLWRDPAVEITSRILKGIGKRMLAGLPVVVTQALGNGRIAFSRDAAGQLVFVELGAGEELHVREHQFLFATDSLEYSFFRVRGISNLLFGGTGFFIDSFKGPGLVALHGYGNVLERELAAGEQIDVEPGAFLYKQASVKMDTVKFGIRTGLFAGTNIFLNRFTGPGKLGIQSMTFHVYTGE
jgi:uncharacterized protein (AIM24 family)